MRATRGTFLLPTLALLGGCATVGNDTVAQQDPLEKVNRAVWGVNQFADRIVVKPVTKGYRAVVPKPARLGVTHFFSNVSEPWSAVNSLLQGKPKRAGRALARFVVNTTLGVAGLGDPASKMGIRPAPEDFGQTLAVWGVNSGPYLVLPLLGPSTLRDAVGTGVGFYADPYRICLSECGLPHHVPLALTVAYTVDVRSQLIDSGADAFLRTSADPYATARSAFLQARRNAILNRDDAESPAGTPAAAAGGDDAALQAALKDAQDANGGSAPAPAQPALPGAGQPATPPSGATSSASGADDAALADAVKDANDDAAPAEPAPASAPPADATAPN